MNTLRNIYASAYASTITILSVVALTVGAELNAPFKNWLAHFTGHHWVTKSWASLIIFFLFFGIYRLFSRSIQEHHVRRALWVTLATVALGTLTLLVFFAYEFFSH